MNLLTDPWLPVLCADGGLKKIAPWQITEEIAENPILALQVPRPDFKNALYQLLIGLLQLSVPLPDEEAWEELWEQPLSPEQLKQYFLKYQECFEIDADGPAFMQDFELKQSKEEPIASLLIESPGVKTLKEHTDHFIKGGRVRQVSPYWAAVALYTLQLNAPSGGAGHRTGMRGGGPLTTLLLPSETKKPASLWHQLWLNVLPKTEVSNFSGELELSSLKDIFPWMGPCKTSEKGQELTPEEGHPCQMYFSMPRRIRLDFKNSKSGICDLSGESCEQLMTSYQTKNYGINYSDTWVYPLNPYRLDEKKQKPPLSIKGQPGGLVYRHWLGLAATASSENKKVATVLEYFYKTFERQEVLERTYGVSSANLWAAGYDMDNMKVRCWYESTMPVYHLTIAQQERLIPMVKELIEAATASLGKTIWFIKQAWFENPKEQAKKADFSFIKLAFWQETEATFYQSLQELVSYLKDSRKQIETYQQWPQTLKRQCFYLFDLWASSGPAEEQDMKRWARARQGLAKWFKKAKEISALYTRHQVSQEAA